MRKCALALAIVMIAAAPTAALAAKKKAAAAPAAAADPNAPAKKFVYEGFMQPVYAWQSATGQKKK
jgi:hypothetical protein